MGVFGIVVTVTIQSVFYLEMHQFFIIFIFFLKSAHQNNSKHKKNIILNKIK